METKLTVVPDVETNGQAGEAPAPVDKSDEALRSIDSEQKRADMEKVIQRATEIWEAFGKSASSRFEKPSARQVAQAVLALDCLMRSDQGQLWMNIGIAVQEARTAVKAVGELGRGLLGMIKAVNEHPGQPLDTAALESALGVCDAAAAPVPLPEGSTRTDPILTKPGDATEVH